MFKSFKQSECSNLLCVVSDKSVNRLGYSFPGCLSSLGHFSPDTVFLIISLNSSSYLSFLFQWWATASSIMSHWFYCRSERTGQKFGGMTNEMRSLGNGWLPYVVCFLSINHLIATELLSRGERKIFCYFLKKMFLRPFTLPGSHQQMWTFHQAVDKEVLSKIKLVLTASVQKHLHNIIYQLGENISQQYVNKRVWQSRSQKCLQGSPRRHIGFNHNFT